MGHYYKASQPPKIGGWPFFGPKMDQKLQNKSQIGSGKKNLPHSEFFILLQKSIISDHFYSLIFLKASYFVIEGWGNLKSFQCVSYMIT